MVAGPLDPLMRGQEFGVELSADRGEGHVAAAAFEQGAADAAFEFLDGLADAAR